MVPDTDGILIADIKHSHLNLHISGRGGGIDPIFFILKLILFPTIWGAAGRNMLVSLLCGRPNR